MHTATKFLVVFVALVAILLSALTMAYAVNADRIVADYKNEQTRRQAAETIASSDVAKAREEVARVSQQRDAFNAELETRRAEIRRLETERSELQSSVKAAESARDSIVQKIDQLGATVETQARLIENYRNEVTTLRSNELEYSKREIQLSDHINDLESQREVLDQSVRALQEQLSELRIAFENAKTGGEGEVRDALVPSVPVRARIVEVGKDATGRQVARISVGSNDQIRPNMKLNVMRDGQFLGKITIQKTDLQWSTGTFDDLQQKSQIRVDDVVYSSPSRLQ